MNLRRVTKLELTLVKKNGVLIAYSHSILKRWKNYFCQLMNIRGVNNVTQTQIHTDEPLVHECSPSDVEMATEKLKRYKLQVLKY